jgi:hypothetical protein
MATSDAISWTLGGQSPEMDWLDPVPVCEDGNLDATVVGQVFDIVWTLSGPRTRPKKARPGKESICFRLCLRAACLMPFFPVFSLFSKNFA